MTTAKLTQKLFTANPDAITFSELAGALIGLGHSAENTTVAVYSKQKILQELRARNMSAADIEEYYSAQFSGFRGGKHGPVILDDTDTLVEAINN